jgi:predicted DNA-binding transcriptional regulator AlpA
MPNGETGSGGDCCFRLIPAVDVRPVARVAPRSSPEAVVGRAVRDMYAPESSEPLAAAGLSLAEPLLCADEIGLLLAVPRSSVDEYARRRHDPLPSIRIGRHVRFCRGDVERWLVGQRSGETTGPAMVAAPSTR